MNAWIVQASVRTCETNYIIQTKHIYHTIVPTNSLIMFNIYAVFKFPWEDKDEIAKQEMSYYNGLTP